MLIMVGYRSVVIVGLVRSQLSMSFLSVNHMIPRETFLDYLKHVHFPNPFEALFRSSIFDKVVSDWENNKVCW